MYGRPSLLFCSLTFDIGIGHHMALSDSLSRGRGRAVSLSLLICSRVRAGVRARAGQWPPRCRHWHCGTGAWRGASVEIDLCSAGCTFIKSRRAKKKMGRARKIWVSEEIFWGVYSFRFERGFYLNSVFWNHQLKPTPHDNLVHYE